MTKKLYHLVIRGANHRPEDVDTWGATVTGPEDFVTQLRASSFVESKDNSDYMHGFAERAYKLHSHFLRTDTCENFVQDLQAVGYLTISEVN